jgi:hypothetical protein
MITVAWGQTPATIIRVGQYLKIIISTDSSCAAKPTVVYRQMPPGIKILITQQLLLVIAKTTQSSSSLQGRRQYITHVTAAAAPTCVSYIRKKAAFY